MMKRQWMAFSIGLVALVAFILLGALVVWFGEVRIALRPRREYYVTFTNALGAEPKAPVRRAGIRIGEISKVEYDEQRGLVVLTMTLEGDNQLRDGDEPRLRATSLLAGDTFLDIETRPDARGRMDRAQIPAGKTLEGRPPLDLGPAAETAQTLAPNANRTLDELQKTSKEWSQVGARANRILEQNEQEVNLILQQTRDSVERLNGTLQAITDTLDPKMRQNLQKAVKNIADGSEDLRPLIADARASIRQISESTRNIAGTSGRLDDITANLQKATKPIADKAETTANNLEALTHNLALVSADAVTLVRQFKNNDGTLQRLMSDPKLYQNLDGSAQKLDGTLTQLQYMLADLRVFADKIARHPGELGVKGVLSRDAGTKSIAPSEIRQTQGTAPTFR